MSDNNQGLKIRINIRWVVTKKNRLCFEFYGLYGEGRKVLSKSKKPFAFEIIKLVYQNKSISHARVVKRIALQENISKDKVRHEIQTLVNQRILSTEPRNQDLTNRELERYKWQLEYLASFETDEISRYQIQYRLKRSRVAVIGLGGQGSIICHLLGSVGVGHIICVDGDRIARSNLPRQLFFHDEDVGKYKAKILQRNIEAQNPDVEVVPLCKYVTSGRVANEVISDCDIFILCADKPLIKLREWFNKAAILKSIPYIAVSGSWVGPLCIPGKTACFECERSYYRKKYPEYNRLMKALEKAVEIPRPSFAFRPVLSGTLIALQVVKHLSKSMEVNIGDTKFMLDTNLNLNIERIRRNKKCKACGT